MPEHLDARKTISRDMFYYILASKLPSQKNKTKNLTPDHKISEKQTLTNYFFYLAHRTNVTTLLYSTQTTKKQKGTYRQVRGMGTLNVERLDERPRLNALVNHSPTRPHLPREKVGTEIFSDAKRENSPTP